MDLKEPRSYKEQLDILKSKGCIVNDEKECLYILESVNYYRLSAYFLPFKKPDGSYENGLTFQKVFSIYDFDRKLHGILFNALEETEIYLRAQIAYFHAHKYGTTGYLNKENFYKDSDNSKHIVKKQNFHKKFIEDFNREIKKNRNVLFVKHHNEKYNGLFPIWVASEIFTFGMLSIFFTNLKTEDKKILSKTIYDTIPNNMESWFRCCTDLRNICAHYGRLYFRTFSAIPSGVQHLDKKSQRKLWGAILALKKLYPFKNKWNNETLKKLASLIEEHKKDINLEHIAFPQNWNELLSNK